MADARPCTVVCVPDNDSRATEVGIPSSWRRLYRRQWRRDSLGPSEPTDWAVVFMAEGHLNDALDEAQSAAACLAPRLLSLRLTK